LSIRRALGDRRGEGGDERWLARLLWWAGRRADAEAAAQRSIALLEPLGPHRELALAYSGLSQLHMLRWNNDQAIAWGERAIALARQIGDDESLAHALTNVGTARCATDRAGEAVLEEAVAIALREGFHDHAARALVNLAWNGLEEHRYPHAFTTIARAMDFADRCDLRSYRQYLLGMRAWASLDTGDWDGAERDAAAALAIHRAHPTAVGHPAMVAQARLLVRRGDPSADDVLDEAWRLALRADEAQRLVPA
ncbi:unnamed protein product, partial [Phaeothamnion confervicola]